MIGTVPLRRESRMSWIAGKKKSQTALRQLLSPTHSTSQWLGTSAS